MIFWVKKYKNNVLNFVFLNLKKPKDQILSDYFYVKTTFHKTLLDKERLILSNTLKTVYFNVPNVIFSRFFKFSENLYTRNKFTLALLSLVFLLFKIQKFIKKHLKILLTFMAIFIAAFFCFRIFNIYKSYKNKNDKNFLHQDLFFRIKTMIQKHDLYSFILKNRNNYLKLEFLQFKNIKKYGFIPVNIENSRNLEDFIMILKNKSYIVKIDPLNRKFKSFPKLTCGEKNIYILDKSYIYIIFKNEDHMNNRSFIFLPLDHKWAYGHDKKYNCLFYEDYIL